MQGSEATADALANDALRAAEVSRDLGVAALLEQVRLDRLALVGGQGLEELDRWSASGCLDDRDRLVIESDRLHRKRTSRLVLDATAALRLAQLVARDREQPGPRRLRPGLKPRHRAECGSERLCSEIEWLFWAAHAAAEEGKHRCDVPFVEDAERLSARARREQKLRIGAFLRVLHASCMTIAPDL